MTRRYVRRRYRRPPDAARPRKCACLPPWKLDAKSFDRQVHERVAKLFGAPLDEVAPDPDLREVVYNAVANGLRTPPRPVPPDVREVAARLKQDGIKLTPATGDIRDRPEPLDLGWSLSDAIIEYRRAGL